MARYDALLVDAYGVLVHGGGAFEGASSFIRHLKAEQMPYFIITNDASRLASSCAAKYRGDGVDIPAERVITSGSLVAEYFERHDLGGAKTLVLGTADSRRYAEEAGAHLVEADSLDFEVLAICDESGFELSSTLNDALTGLFRRIDAGHQVELLLPNPDLIYQRGQESFGFTSGSLALLFEHALQTRYPSLELGFKRLGKPFAPMFQIAVERAGTTNCAVLGDQLATDIKGANDFGLDSVLVATGLTHPERVLEHSPVQPDFILESLVE